MQALNFKKYCPEHYQEILNYDLALKDNFVGWVCHHINGEQFTRKWLKKNNMYFNRTDPHEFKFMTKFDHDKLHDRIGSKKNWDSDSRERARIRNLGKGNPMFGKPGSKSFLGKKHSESYRSHMSFLTNARADAFREHKANGGTLTWNEFQKEYKNGLQAC